MLSSAITSVSGSSEVFNLGLVTYSNESKIKLLKIPKKIISKYGAVSEEAAQEMAENILKNTGSDLGLSVTGIAGPGGGSPDKPVGTVYIGVASDDSVYVVKRIFKSDRKINKLKTSQLALNELRMKIIE